MRVRSSLRLPALLIALVALPTAFVPTSATAGFEVPIDGPVLRSHGRTSALIHVRPGVALTAGHEAARASGLDVGTTYDEIAVFVAYGRAEAFRALGRHNAIEAIEANRALRLFTDSSHVATRSQALLDGSTTMPDGTVIDGSGVGVAVVDSGIDGTHPALSERMAGNVKIVCASHVTSVYVAPVTRPDECIHPQGKVAVPLDDTDTPSAGGHGTHVAGIVAAEANGTPYHGAAPGASLYGVSIGTAVTVENALDGMRWVLDTNAADVAAGNVGPIRVVNNSWGTGTHSRYSPASDHFHSATWKMQEALVASGVTVVQAAGNTAGDGTAATTTPECVNPTPGIICVANYYDRDSGARDGNIDGSSSRGKADISFDPSLVDTWPDVAAPGTRITSTCRVTLPICSTALEADMHVDDPPNQYARLTGTSMAAPHVTGIVAQLLQADPELTPAQVENVLEDTAYKFMWGSPYTFVDPTNADDATSFEKGHGLVDALAAVRFALDEQQPDPDPSPTWTPGPDPTLPPTGPAQTFYFHSTTGNNQIDQNIGANTFDTARPARIAASSDTPILGPAPHTDSMWTGDVTGPIQSLRLGFWHKTTDESTGSFGVYPHYFVTLRVGTGTDAEVYDLGAITVKTDGSEVPATRVTGTFTRHFVPDTAADPDGDPDSLPLNVDPQGRPVTLRLSSGWFHGFGALLYDSAEFPSGFSVNPPDACPDRGSHAADGVALQEMLYLHSETRNGAQDAPLGGTSFDASVPTAEESARFDDVPFARNQVRGGSLDPNWTGAIDGVVCSLRIDLWQKQMLGESFLGQADYLATLWVGDSRIDLPPVQVKMPANSDEVTRISFTIDQMLDEHGFAVPLMIDPAGQPVTLELAGRYIDADISTVIHYDSVARPSSVLINEGYVAVARRATAVTLEVIGNGSKRTLVATLLDEEGTRIAGRTIYFFVDGTEIGSTITDETGRATLAPSDKYPGHRVFRAEFRGDEELLPSGAEVGT